MKNEPLWTNLFIDKPETICEGLEKVLEISGVSLYKNIKIFNLNNME